MRDRIILCLAGFLSAALFLMAGVALSAEREERVALIIGNSAYKESPLANPGNDAEDMAKALGEMGFKVILRRNTNTRAMREAIREFGKELRRAQVGLFFYAGHGVQVRSSNYLIPVGADIQSEADVEDQAIDATYVLRTMEDAQAKVNIVILDACRNNPYASGFRSATRGLAQMTAATGTLIAFSTAPGSVAQDGSGRNGLYTQHLLASMRQPDSDILKVLQRTRAAVVKDTGGKQTPWESTSLTGDFYFVGVPAGSTVTIQTPGAATTPDIEVMFWQFIASSTNPDDFNEYLRQFPNGRFAVPARSRVKLLEQAKVAPLPAAPAPAASSGGGNVVPEVPVTQQPSQGSPPIIEITMVPPGGAGSQSWGIIGGKTRGAILAEHRVVIYARTNKWYVQPWVENPFTDLRNDGSFETGIHLGYEYAILLVDKTVRPLSVITDLPQVGNGVIAMTRVLASR